LEIVGVFDRLPISVARTFAPESYSVPGVAHGHSRRKTDYHILVGFFIDDAIWSVFYIDHIEVEFRLKFKPATSTDPKPVSVRFCDLNAGYSGVTTMDTIAQVVDFPVLKNFSFHGPPLW
jgi:hypothetical protein